MALVAPGITRFSVVGIFAGEPVVNVLDMQIDTTGGTVSRDDAIFAVAGDILNNWTDHMLPLIGDNYSAQSVDWVDLDSSSGSTGSRSATSAETWPMPGAATSADMPGNVALLVRKNIAGGRGRRNGRMYLVGVPEGANTDTSPNNVQTTLRASMDTALASFLGGINDAEGPTIGVQRQLVVVHTQQTSAGPPPVIAYNGYTPVDSLTTADKFATQRRRLR